MIGHGILLVSNQIIMFFSTQAQEIWMKPKSEKFQQCIDRPKNRHSTSKFNTFPVFITNLRPYMLPVFFDKILCTPRLVYSSLWNLLTIP